MRRGGWMVRWSSLALGGLACLWTIQVLGQQSKCASSNYCQAPSPFPFPTGYVHPHGLHLERVALITRHGDRTPILPFTLPHQPSDFWKHQVDEDWSGTILAGLHDEVVDVEGWRLSRAALTIRGREQQRLLGQTLATIYGPLLSLHTPTDIKIRSTPYTRTVLSARALLEGFLPGFEASIPIEFDMEVNPAMPQAQHQFCPRLDLLLDQIKSHLAFKSIHRHMRKLEAQARAELPGDVSFAEINDNINCLVCHGYTKPESLRPIPHPEQFCETAHQSFSYMIEAIGANPDIIRLQIGGLLRQLISDLVESQPSSPKFTLLSAHDTTIAYMKAALQLGLVDQWPPYASNLIIEVWQSQDKIERFIRILYNGEVMSLPLCTPIRSPAGILLLPHPDQLGLCPLNQFLSSLQAYITPGDREKECSLT